MACLHHWQGVALAVHCAAGAGRALGGCGLKTRNKPAQRQRGQHKDIFPCITQQRACSTVTHTQILIWSRKHGVCFVLLVLVFAWWHCLWVWWTVSLGWCGGRSRFLPCRTLTIYSSFLILFFSFYKNQVQEDTIFNKTDRKFSNHKSWSVRSTRTFSIQVFLSRKKNCIW